MSVAAVPATAPIAPMVWRQAAAEFRKLWRVPAFSATSLALPVMFYAFFGDTNAHRVIPGTGVISGDYVMASLGAYAVSNVMVFSFGIGVANERGQKLDLLMRAAPLPALVYLVAKVLIALLFGLLALLVLIGFARLTGSIDIGPTTVLVLTLRLLAGALPFVAIGFAFGYLAGPNSAVAVVNLIYLPMAFASGIFIPAQLLPDWIAHISPYLPLYRYADLAWQTIGVKTGEDIWRDALYLTAYFVVFFALALWAYRRDASRKFS
ncbi:MAG TPA: ABC transporter permease [Candidatus Dormibacteraeota bacterium]